jgi:hypothetical protein
VWLGEEANQIISSYSVVQCTNSFRCGQTWLDTSQAAFHMMKTLFMQLWQGMGTDAMASNVGSFVVSGSQCRLCICDHCPPELHEHCRKLQLMDFMAGAHPMAEQSIHLIFDRRVSASAVRGRTVWYRCKEVKYITSWGKHDRYPTKLQALPG